MSEHIPDDISQLTDALCGLHNDVIDYIAKYNNQPSINSPAILELGDNRYHSAIANAYSQSGILFVIASDQLAALSNLLQEPLVTIAPWTCARGILEASAVASWLVDPAIGVDARVRRSYALRFEGVRQQKMYVDATGESAAPAVKVIQNLEAEATALGLNVFKDPNGKITGIGEHWTSFTALIKLMLNEEADYRLYSAMTHGHSWATTKLGFSVDTSRSSSPLAVSNAVPITKKLLPGAAAALCVVAGKNFAQVIRYKAQLFGWDGQHLAKVVSPYFAAIGEVFTRVQSKPAVPST